MADVVLWKGLDDKDTRRRECMRHHPTHTTAIRSPIDRTSEAGGVPVGTN